MGNGIGKAMSLFGGAKNAGIILGAKVPVVLVSRADSAELLVVDDMKSGFDMAKARSVPFAWAGWGRQNLPEVAAFMKAHCDFSFHTPAQLEHFLFD